MFTPMSLSQPSGAGGEDEDTDKEPQGTNRQYSTRTGVSIRMKEKVEVLESSRAVE